MGDSHKRLEPSIMEFIHAAALSLYLKKVKRGIKRPAAPHFLLSSVQEHKGIVSTTLRDDRGSHQTTFLAKRNSRTGRWDLWEKSGGTQP